RQRDQETRTRSGTSTVLPISLQRLVSSRAAVVSQAGDGLVTRGCEWKATIVQTRPSHELAVVGMDGSTLGRNMLRLEGNQSRSWSKHISQMTSGQHLTLLNGFQVCHQGRITRIPRNGQRLIAFLALNNRDLPRSYVASVLWPDAPEDRAGASL